MARYAGRRKKELKQAEVGAKPLTETALKMLMSEYGSLRHVPPEVLKEYGMKPQETSFEGLLGQGFKGFRREAADRPPTSEEMAQQRKERHGRGRKQLRPLSRANPAPVSSPENPEAAEPESVDVLDADLMEPIDPEEALAALED